VDNDAGCDGVTSVMDCNVDDASQPTRDADCDGVRTASDCDDTDAGLGAVEDDADCDDSDPSSTTVATDPDCAGVPDCLADMDDLGAEVVGTTAYLLITETRSWGSADSDCRDRGYDGLAIILDGDEQSAIARIAADTSGQPWIGLIRTDEWKWRDFTSVDSGPTYWWTAESGTGSGDRGVMLAGSGDLLRAVSRTSTSASAERCRSTQSTEGHTAAAPPASCAVSSTCMTSGKRTRKAKIRLLFTRRVLLFSAYPVESASGAFHRMFTGGIGTPESPATALSHDVTGARSGATTLHNATPDQRKSPSNLTVRGALI
jgi:hypothetical protein